MTTERPSLAGATSWLNSDGLSLFDLRDQIVVVDFCTFTCINWLRTVPQLRLWCDRYSEHGMTMIGVHTPEFTFEHDSALVTAAIGEREIVYPVAIDNDYSIWRSFDNHYWPAVYTLDEVGRVRDYHPGETRYWQPERVIQHLLGLDCDLLTAEGCGIEAAADWHNLRSPETYLGYFRGERLSSPGGATPDMTRRFEPPRRLRLNHWALDGDWTVRGEFVTLERPGGAIRFRFHARDVHIVLSRSSPEPIAFQVLVDDDAPGDDHGSDVGREGSGLLDRGRLYHLVRQTHGVSTRTVEITFASSGAEAYVFTFG